MKEIYISVDVESDGPIPGPNSMLSFGAAAFIQDNGLGKHRPENSPWPKNLVDVFSANLELLEGAKSDPKTMEWWASQPEAWKAHRVNLCQPSVAMPAFVQWIERLEKRTETKAVCVAYPAGYDFTYLYWYMMKFAGRSPFSFSALDIKTYAMAILKLPYRKSTKKNMPKRWFVPSIKHSHVAVEDAIEQGSLFMRMLAEHNPHQSSECRAR